MLQLIIPINASYNLKSNGSSLNTKPNSKLPYNHSNTSNQNYELEVTQAGTTVVKKFTVIVNPDCFSNAYRLDGINYNTADASKAT
jgi:hypothetical protein